MYAFTITYTMRGSLVYFLPVCLDLTFNIRALNHCGTLHICKRWTEKITDRLIYIM